MIALASALTLAQAPPWPVCDDPDAEPRSDCVLATQDQAGWLIGFDYEPDGRARRVEVIVTGADGLPFQSFERDLQRGFRAPLILDLDQDGYDDVLLPVSTGPANSDWALFFGGFTGLAPAEGRLSGYTVEPFVDGLFAAYSRSNAAQHAVTVYSRNGANLSEQAVIAIEFDDQDDTSCRLVSAADERPEAFYCSAALSN